MITPAVHEAALAEASAAAYRDGATAAVAEAERRTAAALERVARVLEGLAGKLAAGEARLQAEAGEIAPGGGAQTRPPREPPGALSPKCAPRRRLVPPPAGAAPRGGRRAE